MSVCVYVYYNLLVWILTEVTSQLLNTLVQTEYWMYKLQNKSPELNYFCPY